MNSSLRKQRSGIIRIIIIILIIIIIIMMIQSHPKRLKYKAECIQNGYSYIKIINYITEGEILIFRFI